METREIKFRAWHRLRHKWVIEGEMQGMFGFRSLRSPHYYWQQYTGLKDKNGKEIYEGDIVKTTFRNVAVTWESASCGFEPFSDSNENCGCCGGAESPKRIEVIGNIYENPELLK